MAENKLCGYCVDGGWEFKSNFVHVIHQGGGPSLWMLKNK